MIKKMFCVVMTLSIFGLIMSGCSETGEEKPNVVQKDRVQKDTPKERKNDHIKINSKHITNEQAEIVFKDMQDLLQSTYSETDKIENASIEFINEKLENNKVSIDANFTVDMTLFEKPEDDVLIMGMKKALSEADNDKAKAAGKNMIDGHLKEMEPYYNKTVQSIFSLRIEFESRSEGDFKYTIYYLLEYGGSVTTHPVKEYFAEHFKENKSKREQMGYDMMKEELAGIKG